MATQCRPETRRRVQAGLACAALCCGALAATAQQPVPKFEVVSIRTLPSDRPPVLVEQSWTPVQPGGRYNHPSTTIVALITFAYGVKQPDSRLLGLPSWKSTGYAVSAKAADDFPPLAPDENHEQVRLMVRHMLADRFRLKIRTEIRQETVLKMSVDPGGLRLKEVAAPVPPEREGRPGLAMGDTGGRMIGTKVTMSGIASAAGTLLRQDVYDETGLKGYYDFNVRWTAPSVPNASAPNPRLGVEGIALFMTTMQDEFGLRFSRATGPVQYWIVDHVEMPNEN